MNYTFGLKESDLEKIIAVLKKYTVEEAIMFGSRAKGNYKNGSDVDIALKGNLDFETVMYISYLLNEETSMPYKFYVLSYESIVNPELFEHINRVGVSFYNHSSVNA